ncbi:MAG TPA: ISAs1 family transposase [Bradyrhizobium sp.]
MAWFSECFRELADPRRGNATQHRLLDILTIALTATVCGAESCVDFADFGCERRQLFSAFMDLKAGIPSHDTFSRLFRVLDPAAFAACFGQFLDQLGSIGAGVVAIDGKTLRRSFDTAGQRSALHVVTAFACERRLVLAQGAMAPHENEIVTARRVLELIDLKGMLVTGDAMHCHGKTAALIRARGGDWLFPVKENRPALHADIVAFFAAPPEPPPVYVTVDGEHGRIETRRHQVWQDIDWLIPTRSESDEAPMSGMAMIGQIEATVEQPGKPTTTSRRYYISSANLTPERFAEAARTHWRIENSLHWVLDTTFNEDQARNRKDHGPENLATLRKLALNMLRTARPDISIRRKRKRSGWSDDFARTVLCQMR